MASTTSLRASAVSSFLLGAATVVSLIFVYNAAKKKKEKDALLSSRQSDCDGTEQEQGPERLWDRPDLDLRLIRKAEAVIQGRTDKLIVVVERCTNDHNYSAILRTAEALGIQTVYIIDPPESTIVGEDGTIIPKITLDENSEEAELFLKENYHNNRNSMPPVRLTSTSEKKAFADHRKFAQNATEWISILEFPNALACLAQLRKDGFSVWVTDLSQEAVPLTVQDLRQHQEEYLMIPCWPMPEKIALVMGTEAVGCSQEMLLGGDLRVYLPMVGFADSLNLSVATALVIQQIFHISAHSCDCAIGKRLPYAGNMSEANRNELRKSWFPKLAQQRLLSSRGKKQRKAILKQIQICERLQTRLDGNTDELLPLTVEQIEKLGKLPMYLQELVNLEQDSQFDCAADALADLIANPPAPLTDVRRADPHRVTFVGKKTKRLHSNHWKDMAATTNTTTTLNATAAFFRERILQQKE